MGFHPGEYQKSASATREYHHSRGELAEYYAGEKGAGNEILGNVFGSLALEFGLGEHVTGDQFEDLYNAKHPVTGEKLLQRQKQKRRCGKDYQTDATKEMSVLYGLGTPQERAAIGKVHEDANRAVLEYIQSRAGRRDHRPGAKKGDVIVTGKIVCSSYTEYSARATKGRDPDPQLHTHNNVPNFTSDGKKKFALEDSLILKDRKVITAIYTSVASKGMADLGWTVIPDGNNFCIAEVPREVVEMLSKRRKVIMAETEKMMAEIETKTGVRPNEGEVKQIVTATSREKKNRDKTDSELVAGWRKQLRERGLPENGRTADPSPAKTRRKAPGAKKSVAFAVVHLSEREAVFEVNDVIEAAIKHSLGFGLMPDQIKTEVQRLVKNKSLLRSGNHLTTAEALQDETKLVSQAKAGRGKAKPLALRHIPDNKLSDEQAKAVTTLLRSRDQIMTGHGPAGAGKTTMMKGFVEGAEMAGYRVIVTAPQGRQAQALCDDGFNAETLAKVLLKPLPKGSVLLIDEAGQGGIKLILKAAERIKECDGRLILIGDVRQHGSVDRGDVLRHLERDAGVTRIELTKIRRQDASLAKTPEEAASIEKYKEAAVLASQGKSAQSFAKMDKLGAVKTVGDPIGEAVKIAQEKSKDGSTLIVTQTRATVTALNEAVRNQRVRDGILTANSTLIQTYAPIDSTIAQRQDPATFRPGTMVAWTQKHGDIARGSVLSVQSVDVKNKQLIMIDHDGKTRRVGLGHAPKFQIVEQKNIPVAEGDQLLLRQNLPLKNGKPFVNGELVSVASVEKNGVIKLKDGRTLPQNYRLFQHGYASTSYGSQGRSVDHVIIADSGSKGATSAKQWYVDLTRGKKSATILTADKEILRVGIEKKGDSKLASDVKWERQPSPREKLVEMGKKLRRGTQDLLISALSKSGLSPFLARIQANAKPRTREKARQVEQTPPGKTAAMTSELPSIAHISFDPALFPPQHGRCIDLER